MTGKHLVTINRQYGSNGDKVGRILAEKLGFAFYDKELIALAAKDSGFTETIFENADEKPSNSLLYSIVTGSYNPRSWFVGNMDMLTNDTLFNIQADVIRSLSDHSCVIVGRCADFILRDMPELLTVFIHSSFANRVEYARTERPSMTTKELEAYVRKQDKSRTSYYSYYANRPWDVASNYDLVIDIDKFGVDGAVSIITSALEIKDRDQTK